MKRSSSTTTFVHTDIDDGKHYMLMSSELEESIDLGARQKSITETLQVDATIKTQRLSFALNSIEADEHGYIVCVSSGDFTEILVRSLLESYEFEASVAGSSFNSKVFKLESGKAYLRLLR